MVPDRTADVARARALWSRAGAEYKHWNAATAKPVKGRKPHGRFIQAFYNDVAKKAAGGSGAWPDGSVFAKDNYMPNAAKTGPGKLVAITFMEKKNGTWFWVKYTPDGHVAKTPPNHPKMPNMPLAGTAKLRCIGCHDGHASRDMVVTKIGK